MGQSGAFFFRGMADSVNNFLWVDPYLDCGCTTSEDAPFSMFQDGRELEHFPMGRKKFVDMENIVKLV